MPTISAMDPGLRYDDRDNEMAQTRARNQDYMIRQYLQNQQLAMQQQALSAQERMHSADLADRGVGREADYSMQGLRGSQEMDQIRESLRPQMAMLDFDKTKYNDQRSDTAPQRQLGSFIDNAMLDRMRGASGQQNGAPGVGGVDDQFLNQVIAGRYGVAYKSPEQRALEAQILKNKLGAAQGGGGGPSFTPNTLTGRATYQKVLQETGDPGQAAMAAQQAEQAPAQAELGDVAGGNQASILRFNRKDTAFSPTQKAATEGTLGGLGMAALGAGIGSIVPGIGTALGAGIGGGLGLLGFGAHGALTGEDDPTDADAAQILQGIKQESSALARARGISLPEATSMTKMKYRLMLADQADKIGADKARQLMAAIESF